MTVEEERLDLALKASNEGILDWDLKSGEIYYSNRLLGFLGYGRFGAPNFLEEPEKHVHPEDLARFTRKLNRVLHRGGKLFADEARIRTNEGGWKWFRARALPRREEDGTLLRLVGSLIDISKRRFAEDALAEERKMIDLVLDRVPINVYFKDKESRFMRANLSTAKRVGARTVANLVGKTDHEFFEKEHADLSRARELEIMETGKGQEEKLEHEIWEDGHDSWSLVTKKVWRGLDGELLGTFGLTHDVTELIETERNLEQIADKLKVVNHEISEERHLLRLVIDNMPVFVYFKGVDSKFVLVNQRMSDLVGAGSPEDVVGKSDAHFFGKQLVRESAIDEQKIMGTGKPVVKKLEKIRWKDGHVSWAVSSKYPWYLPDGTLRGTFGISSDVTTLVETKQQLENIAKILGRQNDALEEQLGLAREIQQAALPSVIPAIASNDGKWKADFHHRYQPASHLAGDFFEVIPLGEGQAGFFVCDVMGHGVRSALIVSMLRGLIEKQGDALGDQPGAFLTGLNDGLSHLLERTSQLIFATAIYGFVDLTKGEFKIASAGHPDPIVKRNGVVEILELESEAKGPGLGMVPEFEFPEMNLPIESMEGIWCFTDGVFEVLGANGEEFGQTGMCEALKNGQVGGDAINRMVNAAIDFAAEAGFEDDLCILGVEFERRT
ncbi:MAG: SpoIIE family protein phosphatase [Akkermansiaceae bacterium]